MDLGTDKIIAGSEDGVGWITFNNPERRNAVSLEMWQAVARAAEAFDANHDVRVVVLTGAGDKAFVSGADISQFEKNRSDADAAEEYGKISETARTKLGALQKPVIAMIRGYCLGGGLGVAMKADIRIASEDAQFGIPAAKLGLAYAYESLKALVHLVGPAHAKEILFTARRLNANEALRIGLVNAVVPSEELEATVRKYCEMITANAPLTIKSSKMTVTEILKDPELRDLTGLDAMKRVCMDSEDYAEGRRAFMEKRKPEFVGR